MHCIKKKKDNQFINKLSFSSNAYAIKIPWTADSMVRCSCITTPCLVKWSKCPPACLIWQMAQWLTTLHVLHYRVFIIRLACATASPAAQSDERAFLLEICSVIESVKMMSENNSNLLPERALKKKKQKERKKWHVQANWRGRRDVKSKQVLLPSGIQRTSPAQVRMLIIDTPWCPLENEKKKKIQNSGFVNQSSKWMAILIHT